jgi:D-glycero-D-manno-heptose 1,7-bisphosphate phosphatase
VTQGKRAAFLDRDGVINADHGYVHRADQFELLPGVADALRRLSHAGVLLIVITNQSGIARGLFTESQYDALTRHMCSRLADEGVQLHAVYHCPHLPDAAVPLYRQQCNCRKPGPGMILRAIAEHGIDPSRSLLVGDKPSDIQAGRAAGVAWCGLVHPAYAAAAGADLAAPDLARCVDAWLSTLR